MPSICTRIGVGRKGREEKGKERKGKEEKKREVHGLSRVRQPALRTERSVPSETGRFARMIQALLQSK